jgi:hypothetical protein
MFSPIPLLIYCGLWKPLAETLAGAAPLRASGLDFLAWVKQQSRELSKSWLALAALVSGLCALLFLFPLSR